MSTIPVTLRVGLIGYGFAGKTFHAPLIQATPQLELRAVVSSDAQKVRTDHPLLTVLAEPSQLLAREDIDLVVIASPNPTHAPLASAALRAGKHVVVDKPFALDLAEARELIQLADRSGRLLSVFQNRRWDSDFLGVKNAIRQGVPGRVTHFESHFDRYRPTVRPRWREKSGTGAGLWYDLGPHLVDQALSLFGLPQRVSGHLTIQRTAGEVDDWAHVRLDYGPLQVILHASMLAAGGTDRFSVHGDRGSLVKTQPDPQEAQLRAGLLPGAPGWGIDTDPLIFYREGHPAQQIPVPPGDYRHYYTEVRDAIAGTAANPVSALQALAVMAVLEAAMISSREGRELAPALSAEEYAAWPLAG